MTLFYHAPCGPVHPRGWVRFLLGLAIGTVLFLIGWRFQLSAIKDLLPDYLFFLILTTLSLEWFYYWHNYYGNLYFLLGKIVVYGLWQTTVGMLVPILIIIFIYFFAVPVGFINGFPTLHSMFNMAAAYEVVLSLIFALLYMKLLRYFNKYRTMIEVAEHGQAYAINLLEIDLIEQDGSALAFQHANGQCYHGDIGRTLEELSRELDPYYFFFTDYGIINRKAINTRIFVTDEDGNPIP